MLAKIVKPLDYLLYYSLKAIDHVFDQTRFSVKLIFFELHYKGEGRILYITKRKKLPTSAGIWHMPRFHFRLATAFIILASFLTFFSILPGSEENSVAAHFSAEGGEETGGGLAGNSGDIFKKAGAKAKNGVGGIGDIHDKDFESSTEFKSFQQDEQLKNKLMGIEDELIPSEKNETQAKTGKIHYKLKPNETLMSVAKKFKINVESIAGSSNIRILDEVPPGKNLIIPTRKGFFYTIKKNDKLANLVGRFRIDFDQLIHENPHINIDLLNAGDEIFLPNARPDNLIFGWILPVNATWLTSGFGYRRYPWVAYHSGIDLKAYYTTVRSVLAGEVTFAGWLGGYGNAVIIEHPGGYKTLYAHLSKIFVSAGKPVLRGQSIAVSGNTGRSTGPHLHFEIVYNGKQINPLTKLRPVWFNKRR